MANTYTAYFTMLKLYDKYIKKARIKDTFL